MKTHLNPPLPPGIKPVIDKYFPPGSLRRKYYLTHVLKVTELAFEIAHEKRLKGLDLRYLFYGSLLHDIGIVETDAPPIGCTGRHPYIAHTWLGRKILEENGFADIALICERHIGVGFTKEEIISMRLPLPHRDMLPVTIEEKLICYADKFYSKSEPYFTQKKPVKIIRENFARRGKSFLERWEALDAMFRIPSIISE